MYSTLFLFISGIPDTTNRCSSGGVYAPLLHMPHHEALTHPDVWLQIREASSRHGCIDVHKRRMCTVMHRMQPHRQENCFNFSARLFIPVVIIFPNHSRNKLGLPGYHGTWQGTGRVQQGQLRFNKNINITGAPRRKTRNLQFVCEKRRPRRHTLEVVPPSISHTCTHVHQSTTPTTKYYFNSIFCNVYLQYQYCPDNIERKGPTSNTPLLLGQTAVLRCYN